MMVFSQGGQMKNSEEKDIYSEKYNRKRCSKTKSYVFI